MDQNQLYMCVCVQLYSLKIRKKKTSRKDGAFYLKKKKKKIDAFKAHGIYVTSL